MTEYVILQGSEEGWYPCGSVTARSVRSAIRSAIDQQLANPPASIVAVPARSWKPVTVKVETKTALKFS